MNGTEQNDGYDEAKGILESQMASFIDRQERVSEALDKSVLTLSGGALVFSMSVLTVLLPQRERVGLLIGSWIFFAVAIAWVLIGKRGEQNMVREGIDAVNATLENLPEQRAVARAKGTRITLHHRAQHAKRLDWANVLALASFFVGIVLLGIFVVVNVIAIDRGSHYGPLF